jgi:hypothetical protein
VGAVLCLTSEKLTYDRGTLKPEVGRVANLSQLMLLLLAKAGESEGSILFLITY